MFGSRQNGANAYASIGMETGVGSAAPHKLIVMLFEGALVAVANAQLHMKSGNIPDKGLSISKAIAIIESGLRASLNKNAGGEIAVNLDALYHYMSGRLLAANMKNEPALLEEVHGLLKDLKNAWESIGEDNQLPQVAAPRATAPDPLAPKVSQSVKA